MAFCEGQGDLNTHHLSQISGHTPLINYVRGGPGSVEVKDVDAAGGERSRGVVG